MPSWMSDSRWVTRSSAGDHQPIRTVRSPCSDSGASSRHSGLSRRYVDQVLQLSPTRWQARGMQKPTAVMSLRRGGHRGGDIRAQVVEVPAVPAGDDGCQFGRREGDVAGETDRDDEQPTRSQPRTCSAHGQHTAFIAMSASVRATRYSTIISRMNGVSA